MCTSSHASLGTGRRLSNRQSSGSPDLAVPNVLIFFRQAVEELILCSQYYSFIFSTFVNWFFFRLQNTRCRQLYACHCRDTILTYNFINELKIDLLIAISRVNYCCVSQCKNDNVFQISGQIQKSKSLLPRIANKRCK